MNSFNNRIVYVPLTVMLVAQVLLSVWAWLQIPEGKPVPVHWGLAGTVDGYGPKGFALSLMPIITALLIMLQGVVERRYSPDQLAESALVIYVRSLGAAALLTVVHSIIVLAALGFTVPVSTIVPIGIGLLFLALGYAIKQLPAGSHMGIKNAWTMRSATAATRTNSMGGWMLILMGIAAVVTGATGNMYLFAAVIVAGCIALVVGTSIYAWLLSKS